MTSGALSADKHGGGAPPPRKPHIELPFLLDFVPLQDEGSTQVSRFFSALKEGRFETTRCTACDTLLFQPRTTCPECMSTELRWEELPQSGRIYAFSAMLMGAPIGMEKDLPFVLGLIDLDGVGLRIFSRFEGGSYEDFAIGQRMRLRVHTFPDGRVTYRFAPAADTFPLQAKA